MIIEKVVSEDAEELLSIYAPYVKNTAVSFEYTVPSVEEFKARITRISSRYPYIKAVENGIIVGYAYANAFKERRAYDWSVETTVYIRQEMKRQGAGRLLYQQLESSLKEMGVLNMNACISISDKEDEYLTKDSYYFHKSMGFEPVGKFHKSGYKFNNWYDMIWVEKTIGEHIDSPRDVTFGKWQIQM